MGYTTHRHNQISLTDKLYKDISITFYNNSATSFCLLCVELLVGRICNNKQTYLLCYQVRLVSSQTSRQSLRYVHCNCISGNAAQNILGSGIPTCKIRVYKGSNPHLEWVMAAAKCSLPHLRMP